MRAGNGRLVSPDRLHRRHVLRLEGEVEGLVGEENLGVSLHGLLNRGASASLARLARGGLPRCPGPLPSPPALACRSEEHTSELQSLMRISYAVFCLKKKITKQK